MVDAKDKSNDNPIPTFIYEKDDEKVEVDANSFSADGKIQFARLLDYKKEIENLQGALVKVQLDIDDRVNNQQRRVQWILDNEINKPEDSEIEDAEVLKDGKGDSSNGKS
mgnify:CR=1 FL=1